jgi:23S rRNA (guanosine2251-2'-O)-methyltransferase
MKKLQLEELGRLSVNEFKSTEKLPVCLVLDNVRSLHNVGSAFRTADAFSMQKIYLTGITGIPPHREIEKTALGATNSVDWLYVESTAQLLKDLKESKYCLVFGNEVHGVSEDALPFADMALEIPQHGTKHSLNISVCLGIVTWEMFKKLRL